MIFSPFNVENRKFCVKWENKSRRKNLHSHLKIASACFVIAAISLQEVSAETGFDKTPKSSNSKIFVSAGSSDFNIKTKTSADRRIQGRVVDALGETLPGVNVVIKGTSTGTTTDVNGAFALAIPESPTLLVFSFVGYVSQDLQVTNQSEVEVKLLADTKSLNEVVVVGYGTQKKSDLTGAISRLTEKEITERPVQNVVQALQGKASGIDVTSNLRPGEVGRIRIRGNRSINASNEPLYVIDGIPLSASEVTAINPNDIASIEILKDASATAIYGSRGANGVILITYKEGKKGKTVINYDVSYTSGKIHSTTDWMGSGELLNWQRQTHINGGTYTGKYGTAPDPNFDIQTFGHVRNVSLK